MRRSSKLHLLVFLTVMMCMPAAAQNAEVLTTTGDRAKELEYSYPTVTNSTNTTDAIVLKPNNKNQSIDGYGFALTYSSCYNLMQMDADMQWFRTKDLPKEVKDYEMPIDFSDLIGDTTLTKLNSIFQELLKRQEDKVDPIRSKFGNIEKEEIDMDAKTLYIKAYIREHERFSFRQLLEKQHSKTEIIVTFLVMLEEMKLGEIEIEQETTFGDIIITSRKAN